MAVLDAGPALTFLARKDTTKILLQGLGRAGFSSPETVRDEVLRKSAQTKTLGTAAAQWRKLESARRIDVLSDNETPALSAAVQRLAAMPMAKRLKQSRDLGELMVVAHASVMAANGQNVAILIQEADGTRMAQQEAARLRHRGAPGSLRVWNTQTVLLRAARSPELPDKATARVVYERMRPLDLALPPIDQTNLLTSDMWTPAPPTQG